MLVMLVNFRADPLPPGVIDTLWGFPFMVQRNGDRICDMPKYAFNDMSGANLVRQLSETYAIDFQPPRLLSDAVETTVSLQDMTVLELKEIARERNISIPAGTNKEGIIALLGEQE